jgi:hypothetical protein
VASITATSPAGMLGAVDVTVTTSGGTSATGAGDLFTYAVPADSLKLRALQVMVTPIVAETSGEAITAAINAGIEDGFTDSGNLVTPSATGLHVNFGGSLQSQPQQEAQARDSRIGVSFAALGYASDPGVVTKAPPLLPQSQPSPASVVARDWSVWADLRGTGWTDNAANIDLHGDQINVTAGIGRRIFPNLLVGIVAGYEQFKYSVTSLDGSMTGDGGTVGSYFSWRFGGGLRLDGALAWSDVNYDAHAGAADGAFHGSRWLGSTGLVGDYRLGVFVLEPSAKIFALQETEAAWTDSLGTLQAARTFSIGRASVGAKVATPFAYAPGVMLTPYVGIFGDYHFSTDNALPVAVPLVGLLDGLSARATAGLKFTDSRGRTLILGGEVGGLGAEYKVWTGAARLAWPF